MTVALAFFALLVAGAQTKENRVTLQPLAIHANCGGSTRCVFDGEDLVIQIAIVNHGPKPIGFPLVYQQTRGPSIRLVDMRTKANSILRTNPVDPALENEFTQIGPSESATLAWVIKTSEIQQFGKTEIDLSAEISLGCKIEVNGRLEDFQGWDTLRIVEKPSP